MRSRLPYRDVPSRWAAVAAALLLLVGLAGCDDTSKSPTPPTSVATSEPERIPGFEASPSPQIPARPTPTPSATPGSTPTPGPTPTPGATPGPITITVTAADGTSAFSPNPAMVKIGQEVRWHNADVVAHTAASATPGLWTTESIAPGATSAPKIFAKAGNVSYRCSLHVTQVGSLTVGP